MIINIDNYMANHITILIQINHLFFVLNMFLL